MDDTYPTGYEGLLCTNTTLDSELHSPTSALDDTMEP